MRCCGDSRKKYRFRVGSLLLLLALFLSVELWFPHHTQYMTLAASRVQVYDRRELKEELKKDGKAVIELMETVTVRGSLRVRGTKILTGPGELRRAVATNSAFGGSLLRVNGGSLTLKNITLNGRGEAGVLKGKLYGYLVSVDSGQLVIGSGAVLKNNRNTTRLSDGGGAVRVGSGGIAVLNGGSICDNTCVTGGGGVRVESGGEFYMKSGVIKNNKAVGRGAVDGFDGRGGGIYNRGTTGLYGGTITGNSVTGFRKGARRYGGVGGGVANTGTLWIQEVSLRGNSAMRGSDLGVIDGKAVAKGTVRVGECWLRSGYCLQVGGGFQSGGKIRLVPEKVKAGTRLVTGVKGGNWKRWFSLPGSVRSGGLEPKLTDGTLRLVKKKVTPTPTAHPGGGSSGGRPGGGGSKTGGGMPGSGGSSRPGGGAGPIKPAKTATPRVHPTYLPVRAADPSENYFFGTTAPTFVPLLPSASVSPVAVASPMATVTAAPTIMLTITPTPMRTPYPRRPSHALPYFYLYPSAGQADLPETVEAPVSWHFSAQEIASIREELTEGKYQTDAGAFLSRIEKDRIRSEG